MSKLDSLMAEVNKKFKQQIMTDGLPEFHREKIPFSSMRLNYMTYGGIPREGIVEFFGEEGGGKTTTALDIVANAQKVFAQEAGKKGEPLKVLWIDAENQLDDAWAKQLGVDVEALKVFTPVNMAAEDILEVAISAAETGEIGLIVLDSIGSLMSRKEMEGTVEDKQFCGVADPMRKFVNKIRPITGRVGCCLLCINQLRDNVGAMFPSTKTPGGRSYKHALDLRLQFQKGALIAKDGSEQNKSYSDPAGHMVMVSLAKTRVCKPNRKTGHYVLDYEKGIEYIADLADLCLKLDIISKSGSWFEIVDPKTGEMMMDENDEPLKLQGRSAVLKFLQDNPKIFKELKDKKKKKIK